MLHALVLLKILIQFGLELREVSFELLAGGVEWFHGFKGDAGEGAAIASLIGVVVQYAHLATVGQV